MKTKSVTLSVLRTSYAQLDVTAHVPVDATQEQIREAVLNEAHNQVFSEHSSDVELETDCGDEGEVRARKALKNLLQSLIDVGFGASGPIEGSEAVNAVSAFFDNLGMHLFGTGIEAGVVHSESQRGFWRDGDGWGSCELATVILDRSFSMPDVADATFVPLSTPRHSINHLRLVYCERAYEAGHDIWIWDRHEGSTIPKIPSPNANADR